MGYDVNIHRQGLSALFDLKGQPRELERWAGESLPALPGRPNSRSAKGDDQLFFIGPDHWILRAPIDREDALSAALRPEAAPPDISIVRISDTMTFFSITGPDAHEIMAIGCPLDVQSPGFDQETVTFTEMFGMKALVQRIAEGFECAVEQSFANLMADYLGRALK